jgi:hypothetical protein
MLQRPEVRFQMQHPLHQMDRGFRQYHSRLALELPPLTGSPNAAAVIAATNSLEESRGRMIAVNRPNGNWPKELHVFLGFNPLFPRLGNRNSR